MDLVVCRACTVGSMAYMPTIDNLYALSELLQVPIDAIVRGNRAPIVPDIIVKPLDSRESRLCAYYEKLQEKLAA